MFDHLDSVRNCKKYIHNELMFSKSEFNSIQNIENIRCEWSQNFLNKIKDCYHSRSRKITVIEKPPFEDEYYLDNKIESWIKNINTNLDNIEYSENELNNNFWNDFRATYGLILIYFAFSMRFAIAINKLRDKN